MNESPAAVLAGDGTPRRITVVAAGLSDPSSTRLLADRLAAATRAALDVLGVSCAIEFVELRPLARDIAAHLVTGYPPPALATALGAVEGCEALIVVTPVFTASYSGLFKSFFDLVENTALTGRPVLIAATGGTSRHSLVLEHALRPMFAYLRAVVVPTGVYAATSDWGNSGDPHTEELPRRIGRSAAELAALLAPGTPLAGGPASPAPDGDEEVVSFERHLEAVRARPARR
ncbi:MULTISPECIES: CE1759 family FMN reductase [unclassified Streptomyces]|uniref:CE1759 family FMN reductase n=1 Tax=unclassified Streptomyces TaxID=2593676 RepID=UPI00331C3836